MILNSGFDWSVFLIDVLIGVITILIIYLVERIIRYIIKKKFKARKDLPKDAVNGIVYVIRVISAFIILFVFLWYFQLVDSTATLNFTTIFSTAIGFSSAIAIGNFIAGLYLLVSRPYQVGDYVQMGDLKGFVTEIGLNYTKIKDSATLITTRVPNKVAMNENLHIYKLFEAKKAADKIKKMNKKKKKKKKRRLEKLYLRLEKIVRYIMSIECDFSLTPDGLLTELEKVCAKWREVFGYQPQLYVEQFGFRVEIKIVIPSEDMKVIQANVNDFLDDIWIQLYSEEKVVP